jgi:hypothetical protein
VRVSAYLRLRLRLRLPLRVCACNAVRSPYDVAPQFATDFNGSAGQAPRTPNWNVGREGKDWLVGQHHVMKEGEILFRCTKPSFHQLPRMVTSDHLPRQARDKLDTGKSTDKRAWVFTAIRRFVGG